MAKRLVALVLAVVLTASLAAPAAAGAVRFNGGSFKWTSLLTALQNTSDGAVTAAFVIKRAVDDANFHGLGYLLSSTGNGVTEFGLSIEGSTNQDSLLADINGESVLRGNTPTQPTITGTIESYFLVISKAAGTSAITFSVYPKSVATWTHVTSNNTLGNQTAATMLELGAWQTGDLFNGWMAVAAFWEGEMSQANKEALVTNWRTSDLWTSAHGQPTFLTELNTATPTDLAGNASSRTTTGSAPTLDAAETMAGWNFDGTGGGGGFVPRRRSLLGVGNRVRRRRRALPLMPERRAA